MAAFMMLAACNNASKKSETTAAAEQAPTQDTIVYEHEYLVKVGDMAPDFTLKYTDGSEFTLSALRGKVVMLQFTASWCGICRGEMPHIESRIWQPHKDNADFVLVGVDREEPREVVEEYTCMVDLAKFFLEFTVDESCGKCAPCRIGTVRLLEILTKITEGNGEMEDLDKLEELANYIKSASLCGLGQTAPNPVLSTLANFRDEYIAHIVDKKCPAGVCKNLMTYKIDQEKCIGCGMCMRQCPADAIYKTDYVAPGHKLPSLAIDASKCVKCGACMTGCKKINAIYKD